MRGALALVVVACRAPAGVAPPTANGDRDIADTRLAFDVGARTATAAITFGASAAPGASLEIGDLAIERVTSAGAELRYAATGNRLDLALPANDRPARVEIAYRFRDHEKFDGASANGYTFIWPYYCGNLFPCHSNPRDGATFALDVTGVPAGQTAVFAPAIPTDAPAYQVAWAIGAYTELPLGATAAGTQLAVWYRPGERDTAHAGTAHLRAAFAWFETTLGRYRFGAKAGSVSVGWPDGALGGMEHHPRWHIATAILGEPLAHVHEAAHGWFGDGVRIACWEDFVLSEGTVSYLAARALEVVAPAVGAAAWAKYEDEVKALPASPLVWPQSCGRVDVLADHLFTNAPYSRGAMFYRAVALRIGAERLDRALARFYADHAGTPAHMRDMLATIRTVTGFDPTACAHAWLEDTSAVPAFGACR